LKSQAPQAGTVVAHQKEPAISSCQSLIAGSQIIQRS
jgi:hypothetical protein